ncbi:MAG TPA: hypothetical protein VNT25_01335, partial [Allosphingosinicella sp.]|nr:hypothetical protein [Allosphingosinicella sp.]
GRLWGLEREPLGGPSGTPRGFENMPPPFRYAAVAEKQRRQAFPLMNKKNLTFRIRNVLRV